MNVTNEQFEDVVAFAAVVVQGSFLNGGATVAYNAGKPSEVDGPGFVVGGGLPGIKLSALAPLDAMIFATARYIQQLPIDRQDYIGGWVDEEILYIDVVDFYQDRHEALKVARKRGELAIYDLGAGEEIRTDDYTDLLPVMKGEADYVQGKVVERGRCGRECRGLPGILLMG